MGWMIPSGCLSVQPRYPPIPRRQPHRGAAVAPWITLRLQYWSQSPRWSPSICCQLRQRRNNRGFLAGAQGDGKLYGSDDLILHVLANPPLKTGNIGSQYLKDFGPLER